MVSIIKRRKNYSVVYSYIDENGKARLQRETFDTDEEARKRKAQIEHEQETGTFTAPTAKTVTDSSYEGMIIMSCEEKEYLRKLYRMFAMAAEQGNGDDLYEVGYYYEDKAGRTLHKTYYYEIAVECFSMAADCGNADAMFRLGDYYYYGVVVPKDEKKMLELDEAAANLGNEDAQYLLGDNYWNGFFVSKDENMAAYWFEKCRAQGGPSDWLWMGDWYIENLNDYSRAFVWYKKAAEHGYREAQYKIGEFYFTGTVVDQDYSKAIEWYEKAFEQKKTGTAIAAVALGWCYENGVGVSQNYDKAAKYYEQAVTARTLEVARWNLGICYYNGYGVKKDVNQAEEFIKEALREYSADDDFRKDVELCIVTTCSSFKHWLLIDEARIMLNENPGVMLEKLDERAWRHGIRTKKEWKDFVLSLVIPEITKSI